MGRYLLFRAGEARLAVPLELVRQVVDPARVREIPAGPEGGPPRVALPDGSSIPLLDLAAWRAAAGGNPEKLIVLEEKGLTVALFIDKMDAIRDQKSVSRHDVPPRLGGFCPGISGLVQAGRSLYLLLDPAAMTGREEHRG